MKKSERLKSIVGIQSQQEKQALEALGMCQRQHLAMTEQLRNLQLYRQEYTTKYDAIETRGASVSEIMEFRAFITKLDKAIDAQQQTVDAKNKELMRFRKNWEQKHQKTKSLQKIVDQAAGEESKLADRLEQLAQDERASRYGRKGGMENA